ncbi:unnamed protein product [Linum tenue]|uniref:Uncharacterized protein n=1 Tax=Linum tenue TaxID=586396 RepID=A0AAV0NR42_9ROSI|nr:unnamed protein product [Linum tenue]
MVENQIPIFVLQDIATTIGGKYKSSGVLSSGLIQLCRRFSPLELKSSYPLPEVDDAEPLHLLDLLYNLILLKRVEKNEEEDPDPQLGFLESVYHLKHPLVLAFLWPVKHLSLFVPKILSAIPILNNLIDLNVKKVAAPIISSASELKRVVVKLQAASGSVRDISFRSRTLAIPKFTWNPICQVILQNLVAYESMAKYEEDTLILTQYGKLMDGLIRSEADVGLLREVGIVVCGDQDIVDVVSAFSGIGESIGIKDKGLMGTVRDLRIFHANSHNLRTFFWVCVVVLVVAAIVEVYSLEKAPSGSTKPILGLGRRVNPAGSWRSSKVLAAIIQSFKIINLAGPFTTKSTILSH